MTPAEVAFRGARALQAHAERLGLVGAAPVPAPDLAATSRPWVFAPAIARAPGYVAAAERIRNGALDIFALRGVDLGQPPRWNRDPKSGIQAPLAYGKTLDYRDPDLVGDITYLWAPNRHLHFVTLAQAYAASGQAKYFEELAEQLDSWLVACPYRLGPNWASALEAAVRLVNWSLAWQLVGGARCRMFESARYAELRLRWLRSVYQHAEFVRGWFSRHSSANHHLIGEAAGLFIAGLTWPHWKRAALWADSGQRILEREALAQNAPDGANREQALSCQGQVLDFLLLALLAGTANGRAFPAEYSARIEAMLDYLASIMDAGGNVPQLGDAGDGESVRLAQGKGFCPYRSLLATGAILFGRGDFKLKAGALDDKTRALFGVDAEESYAALDARKTRLPLRQTFPEGGYYVLGCEFDTPHEIRLVADAGALGYRSLAAHGHADALAFTLSAGGREFLIDPGTYAHHTQGAWRSYFRGTSAHNTVRIDGEDQSVQGGSFMWLAKANAGCSLWLSSADKDCFEGWHDGYRRLDDQVKHRRLIELDKRARRIVVEDTLEMAEDHEVELFFHCHEESEVRAAGEGFVVRRGNAVVRLSLPKAAASAVQIYRGSLAPMAGWVSRAFDCRRPAPTIAWRARLTGTSVLRTEILVGPI
ncbi:MAG TPA: alginate lyase family protein [Burkholderiales bacterium]|nr:alginate lyase family protein [Burkholderiales bacterium]